MEKNKCVSAPRCGGCRYFGIPMDEQLHKKQKRIEKLLGDFAEVKPIIGMADPCYYRNKVHHVLKAIRGGTVISGTYQEGTHHVVRIDECGIEDLKCQEIIRTVCSLAQSFKYPVYNEDTGWGFLRHVLVRRGFKSGEIMVVLVCASTVFPSKNNFVKALRHAHPEITSIVQNINNRKTSMVLGDRNMNLFGSGYIYDELCGLRFRISPDSFYQVNPVQTEILYAKAMEYASLTIQDTVLDAYSGIGTIGLTASKSAGKVIGVELNKNAVRDAICNARENGIKNAVFYQGDAGRFMVEMAANKQHVDAVFMDPPRSGSTVQFMNAVIKMNPGRIVYISCEPETLARDLRYFTRRHYEVKQIQPVDMFPYTEHVETVCQLIRRKPDAYVHIDVDLEDYYKIKDSKKDN